MNWENEFVIVTGGCGFVGSHVVTELMARGATDILVVDNLSRGKREYVPAWVNVWESNLAVHPPSFGLRDKPPIVFHLAAKVAGIQYNSTHQYDMLASNLAINANVFAEAQRHKPKLLVYISTACVYGHDAPVPTPESAGDTCNPEATNWGYGVAKWTGEQQVKFLHKELGVPALIVRLFNVFGKRDHYDEDAHVAPALIKRALSGENPLVVWGSGKQTRSLVDARDIAKALVELAETPAAHDAMPVNIGHEREVSIGDLAMTIALMAESDTRIIFDARKPDGHSRRAPDTTRLKSLIGWVPDMPLEQTIKDMIGDYRARFHAA